MERELPHDQTPFGGGIAPRLSNYLADSQFRARFEAKGRFQAYVAAIPSWVIMHPDPAFIGLQRLARQEVEP